MNQALQQLSKTQQRPTHYCKCSVDPYLKTCLTVGTGFWDTLEKYSGTTYSTSEKQIRVTGQSRNPLFLQAKSLDNFTMINWKHDKSHCEDAWKSYGITERLRLETPLKKSKPSCLAELEQAGEDGVQLHFGYLQDGDSTTTLRNLSHFPKSHTG